MELLSVFIFFLFFTLFIFMFIFCRTVGKEMTVINYILRLLTFNFTH